MAAQARLKLTSVMRGATSEMQRDADATSFPNRSQIAPVLYVVLESALAAP